MLKQMINEKQLDKISLLVILRALFIYLLVEKGWSIKKCKNDKNTFEMYKSVKKKYTQFTQFTQFT